MNTLQASHCAKHMDIEFPNIKTLEYGYQFTEEYPCEVIQTAWRNWRGKEIPCLGLSQGSAKLASSLTSEI